jgi:hypothetical protein
VDQTRGATLVEHEGDFRPALAGVHRHRDQPGPGQGQERLHEGNAVVEEQPHPIAGTQATAHEIARDALDRRIELAVARPVRPEDERRAVGMAGNGGAEHRVERGRALGEAADDARAIEHLVADRSRAHLGFLARAADCALTVTPWPAVRAGNPRRR